MKKFFIIIVLIIFNKSSEQAETQDWKSMRDQFVSSIQTMILMFKFSNYELYETYKEYFDMTETIIQKIKQIDSIEQFSEEIEALFSNTERVISLFLRADLISLISFLLPGMQMLTPLRRSTCA